MIRFYMDENVQDSITAGLRQRGVDVLTVREDARGGSDDPTVFARAIELGRVLFSRDADMLAIAADYQQRGEEFHGLIYTRQNGLTEGRCVEDLELVVQIGQPDDFANLVRYLPL